VPLSRHIFKAPTRFYKTGVVFMALSQRLQDHFTLGRRPGGCALDLAPPSRVCSGLPTPAVCSPIPTAPPDACGM